MWTMKSFGVCPSIIQANKLLPRRHGRLLKIASGWNVSDIDYPRFNSSHSFNSSSSSNSSKLSNLSRSSNLSNSFKLSKLSNLYNSSKLSNSSKKSNLSNTLNSSNLSNCSNSSNNEDKSLGLWQRSYGMESNFAKPGTNRWKMFIPAFATHVCIGAPYGWSAISASLSREYGMVVSAASDWSLDCATYPMSLMIAMGGFSAAMLGKWSMKVGTRKAMLISSLIYSGGFALAASGIYCHSLSMLYAGNLLSGVGYGCLYTAPIQALIEWFPDRKGLASGLVIAGFGSGALFFTPLMNLMMSHYSTLPTFLGRSLDVVTEGGRQFTDVGGHLQEVVYATAADLAKLPFGDMAEGFYLVGSGSSGVAAGLLTMGGIYAAITGVSSLMIRRPYPGYLPDGYNPAESVGGSTGANVNVDTVMKTPQFWLLFTTATLLATGGMGLMSVAKPMIQNVFTEAMPLIVTSSFASSYLMVMAVGNLAGRFGWAAISDKIGRRNMFHCFTLGAVPIFLSLPYFINQVVMNPSHALATSYLAGFCVSSVLAVSVLGGTFAVLPAYEADLYGPKYVGPIHGIFLVAASIATLLGPAILLNLRKMAENDALRDLLTKVDPVLFTEKFGADLSDASALIEAKTLTISKLMSIMPTGTIDPSPFLYNNTMYTMAGLVSIGAGLHFIIRPVDTKYFEKI